jgi:dihydrolipoamide dehydrogenase
MSYDLIILGGGPAGYLAAERAGHAGLSVALCEERSLGGVCLNEGCIPTKAMLYSAKLFDGAKHGEKYGVSAEKLAIDHEAVVRRKDKVVRTLVAGVKSAMKANHVEVFPARGRITGKGEEGYTVKAGDTVLSGKRLLIATGSLPSLPPIPGLKEALARGFALTSRELLDLKQAPERLCVIGGGAIGLEFASYFCSIGVNVTVVEMLDHVAGENDRELVSILKSELEKRGIAFELEARVTALEENGVRFEQKGESRLIEAGKVLVSIGRRANTADAGLEAIGVYMERGNVVVDDHMRTNQPGVFAAGDVTGFYMLAHTAYREAEVAVNNMLGNKDLMRYEAIPTVIYTSPELTSIGETEETAREKGLPYKVVKLPMRFSGRYLAENEGGTGVMKLVVNQKTLQVLGVAALSNYSSEFIVAAGTWIEMGMRLNEIKKIVFPHPTVSEILREAVFQYE